MAIKNRRKPGTDKTHTLTTGTAVPEQKARIDRPISDVYPAIDNDLARDNLENDLTEADLQDL